MPTSDGVALRGDPALRRVRLIDADPTWRDLIGQWLASMDCALVAEPAGDDDPPPVADLVIVDVPFPRCGGVDLVRRIASLHPATPILALSTNFFSGIECCGPVARTLGVDCVLPKPANREALARAVQRVLPR